MFGSMQYVDRLTRQIDKWLPMDGVLMPINMAAIWKPQPKQAELLDAFGVLGLWTGEKVKRPKAKRIGYGGAAGGGKTDGALGLAGGLADAFPGCSIGFFRRTFPELEGPQGAIQRSMELFSTVGTYSIVRHEWVFRNKSRLRFCHAQLAKDVYKYQSTQFDFMLFDESTHYPWEMLDYLLTRNRATVDGVVTAAGFFSNPGNIGHAWYKHLFVDAGAPNVVHHRVLPGEVHKYEDVLFIPSRLEDNQILEQRDPEYRTNLENRTDATSSALLDGDWDKFAGQVFKTWKRERHVCRPFTLPEWWPKWRATDWGRENPFCTLWFARDPDSGRVYVYRELYRVGLTDKQQALTIRELTPPDEKISLHYADPSMWTEKSYQNIVTSTADEYGMNGVYLTRADNNRLNGKRKVDGVLESLPDGGPGLVVFETCVNLIRTLPLLVHDAVNVEDVDTGGEDHAYDTLRYGLTNVRAMGGGKRDEDGRQKQTAMSPIEGLFG